MVDIYNTRSNTLLSGTSENDSIRNGGWFDGSGMAYGGSNVTIVGGAGKDYIHSYNSIYNSIENSKISEYVTISGGTDDDNIDNRSYNSSISGGDGNDKITNYGDTVTINGDSGNDTVWNNGGSNVTIDAGTGNDTIDNHSSEMSISGNSGNDSIKNHGREVTINGGKGNDSLWGGAGNDSLWGGDGNDTFIYKAGEGTDKIFDYSSGDMLKILKSSGKTGSFSKSKYSGGTLSLTISGGGQVLFDNVTTSTDFNINSASYKISGSKLVKR